MGALVALPQRSRGGDRPPIIGVWGVISDASDNVIFATKCLALSPVLIFFDISNFAICKCK